MGRSSGLPALVAALCLLAGCGTEPQEPTTGAARGSLAVPVGAAAGTPVSGTVTVVLDTVAQTVTVDGSVQSDGTVPVECLFGPIERGRRALIYVADLTVNGVDTVIAGYTIVDIAADDTAGIDGALLTPMAVGQTHAVAGAPQCTYFTTDAAEIGRAHV